MNVGLSPDRVDPAIPIEDALGAARGLPRHGEVKHIGLSETIGRAHTRSRGHRCPEDAGLLRVTRSEVLPMDRRVLRDVQGNSRPG